ncbi:hypothetical protein Ae717Ps2_6795c [Pseudonocardia sp. Ae717_Ps2]|nr:hypothetical protein Ae717Ps2_6795c [Pseudonocardia sp. Ae717_Ps2]
MPDSGSILVPCRSDFRIRDEAEHPIFPGRKYRRR